MKRMKIGLGYIPEPNELDHHEVASNAMAEKNVYKKKMFFFNLLYAELSTNWNGKKLNRRLATALKQKSDLTISFNRDKTFGHRVKIQAWDSGNIAFGDGFSFQFDGDKPFSTEEFENEHPFWFKGVYEQIEHLEQVWVNSKELVEAYNQKVRAFCKAKTELDASAKTIS
jgi:hypothetical protein